MPALPRPTLALTLALLAGGCAAPEGDWPQLAPTEALLAEPAVSIARTEAQSPAIATDPLLARAEALRARAAQLQAVPVIDPATAARMQSAQPGV